MLTAVLDEALMLVRRDVTPARRDIEASGMWTMLAGLPDERREVITLAFYCSLRLAEIAARLGLPADTVKHRMRLGLHELRRDLQGSP